MNKSCKFPNTFYILLLLLPFNQKHFLFLSFLFFTNHLNKSSIAESPWLEKSCYFASQFSILGAEKKKRRNGKSAPSSGHLSNAVKQNSKIRNIFSKPKKIQFQNVKSYSVFDLIRNGREKKEWNVDFKSFNAHFHSHGMKIKISGLTWRLIWLFFQRVTSL